MVLYVHFIHKIVNQRMVTGGVQCDFTCHTEESSNDVGALMIDIDYIF